jgi:hypothetical protein
MALSGFKLAIMVEGVYRRALADPTRGNAEAMGEAATTIAREAQALVRD